MKKIKALILPFMVIPFLASCASGGGGGGGEEDIDYTVTKQEFEKAILLDDVEYAQIKSIEYEPDVPEPDRLANSVNEGKISTTITESFSPTVYSAIGIAEDQSHETGGRVVHKISDNETVVYYTEDGENWTSEPGTASDFKTVQSANTVFCYTAFEIYYYMSLALEHLLTYSDLTYDSNLKMYTCFVEIEPENSNNDKAQLSTTLMFKNKQIAELHFTMGMDGGETGGIEIYYEFEKIDPDIPDVPPVI